MFYRQMYVLYSLNIPIANNYPYPVQYAYFIKYSNVIKDAKKHYFSYFLSIKIHIILHWRGDHTLSIMFS